MKRSGYQWPPWRHRKNDGRSYMTNVAVKVLKTNRETSCSIEITRSYYHVQSSRSNFKISKLSWITSSDILWFIQSVTRSLKYKGTFFYTHPYVYDHQKDLCVRSMSLDPAVYHILHSPSSTIRIFSLN